MSNPAVSFEIRSKNGDVSILLDQSFIEVVSVRITANNINPKKPFFLNVYGYVLNSLILQYIYCVLANFWSVCTTSYSMSNLSLNFVLQT